MKTDYSLFPMSNKIIKFYQMVTDGVVTSRILEEYSEIRRNVVYLFYVRFIILKIFNFFYKELFAKH